jgi:hypothetical protein
MRTSNVKQGRRIRMMSKRTSTRLKIASMGKRNRMSSKKQKNTNKDVENKYEVKKNKLKFRGQKEEYTSERTMT